MLRALRKGEFVEVFACTTCGFTTVHNVMADEHQWREEKHCIEVRDEPVPSVLAVQTNHGWMVYEGPRKVELNVPMQAVNLHEDGSVKEERADISQYLTKKELLDRAHDATLRILGHDVTTKVEKGPNHVEFQFLNDDKKLEHIVVKDGTGAYSGAWQIAQHRQSHHGKGYTGEHDDSHHTDESLARVAAYLACPSPVTTGSILDIPPWGRDTIAKVIEKYPIDTASGVDNNRNRRELLAIAGSLIAAEIDRLGRLASFYPLEAKDMEAEVDQADDGRFNSGD